MMSTRRMSAPRLLIASTLLGAATGQEEVTFPAVHQASAGWYDLNIGQVDLTEGGAYGIKTRGFTTGATFRMKPGESLQVKVTNNMLASNNKACSTTAGEFCEATITNLHTHGLHVSSKGVSDGLTYDSDNIFADIAPGGATKQFEFTIPDYHMGGTHWYHPHHHHATALQAGGGAAGVIIVEDPVGYLPAEYSAMTEKILFVGGHNLQTLQTIALSAEVTDWLETGVADAAAAGLETNLFTVNGMVGPKLTMGSHSWYRLRMIYAAVEQTLKLTVTGDATCTMNLLAKDGVYLHTIPRAINTIHLYPGARADVAISCTCATYPCTGGLTSGARRLQGPGGPGRGQGGAGPGAAGMNVADVEVLVLSITETAGGSVPVLPTTVLYRPCYLADLRSATVPAGQTGVLALNGGGRVVTWNGNGQSMTYANVHANGGTKESWNAIGSITTGTVWEMEVQGANAHPLHLHVQPYQIISMGGATTLSDGYFQAGDWHDTLYLEDLGGGAGNDLVVRMNTDVFTGKMVVHCHILEHEDEGMMAWIDLTGTEGATYAEAATLQPGCYTTAFSADSVDPTPAPVPTPAAAPTPPTASDHAPSKGVLLAATLCAVVAVSSSLAAAAP